jgi:tetratricopeptide (TPR) repeat protein
LSDLVDEVVRHIERIDPQLDLENAASDDVFVQPTGGAGGTENGEGDGSKASSKVEIIGPVDLPLMSFDDDDDDAGAAAKAGEEAAAKAAEEATAKAAEEAAAEAAADAATAKAPEDTTASAEQVATAKAAEEAAAEEAAAEEADAGAAEEAAAEQAAAAAKAAAEEAAAAKAAAEQAAATKAAGDGAATTTDDGASASGGDPATDAGTSSSGQYVDLGAVLLGEEVHTGQKKSTRFVVPYEEPTGDDQADFEKMLAQFREKVSENIEADDSIAHYDLGTAYMEMGLLDEAISEFQMVLRGTSSHLPTYEMLGKTFLQKEEPEAALRSLTRGLDAPCEIEEERVGMYYYMGLAHETLGQKDTAMEFYDRVFAIDINFGDVTERLKALRG